MVEALLMLCVYYFLAVLFVDMLAFKKAFGVFIPVIGSDRRIHFDFLPDNPGKKESFQL